ncbi:MAG: hypothetical protein ACI9G1_000760, partial [Pirellulaceae bacterium]
MLFQPTFRCLVVSLWFVSLLLVGTSNLATLVAQAPKPSEAEPKPSDTESKPSEAEPKTSDTESKPSDTESKPSDAESKPSEAAKSLDSEPKAFDAKVIRATVAKAIPLLEKGAAGSAEQRTCFTCHSQAIPVMAFSEAIKRGFEVDKANYERQLEHTSKHLERGKKKYLE